MAENQELKARLADLGAQRSLVGQSPAFRSFLDTLKQAAPSTATVLLLGESGTGKELAARALHELSGRAAGPFVAVNCAAIPETHPRGRAVRRREGRLHRRHRPAARALRARQRRHPLPRRGRRDAGRSAGEAAARAAGRGDRARSGGTQTVKVDVRLVAATNKDLGREVAEGRFREDLYYRLNVVEIRPPAAAPAPRGHPAAGRPLPPPVRGEERQGGARLQSRGARRAGGLRLAGQRARAGARGGARGGARPRRGARRRRPAGHRPRRARGAPRATWSSPSARRWRRSSGA